MGKERLKPITPEELSVLLDDQPYDLSGRLLVGVHLADSSLEGIDFRGAVLRGCTISRCKLDNSNFCGADLGDTVFTLCRLEYCEFDGAKQEDATFDRCALFGSTGINGDTRMRSEVIFDGMMDYIEGVNLDLAKDWRQFIRDHVGPDEGAYDQTLWELQEKFHEINDAYPGMGAEIFNSDLRFLPHQLHGAANFVACGNTVEAAHQLVAQGAFTGAEPLPEQSMYVLPHSEVQKNILAQREFAARMKQIEGLNYTFSSSWAGLAREIACAREGVTADEDYRQLLQEYGDAFEQIGQYDTGAAAAMFSYPAAYLPQEMLTAAEWIGNGGSPEEAYEAFQGQQELSAIHAKHTLWRQGDPDGVRADFTGRALKNLTFYGTNFDGAAFTGAHFVNCWMHDTSFAGCDFSEASFLYVSAIGADFGSAVFDGAALDRSIFQSAYLEGASFAGAAVTGCDFRNAGMETVDLSQAGIHDCVGLEGGFTGMTMQ